MAEAELRPADQLAVTLGVVRDLFGAWVLWGLFWYLVVQVVDLPGFAEFLLLASAVPLGGASVFAWRAYGAYRESSR